jgi:TP901 family phage tail tape measure protein
MLFQELQKQEFAALSKFSSKSLGRTTFFTAEQVGQLQLNFSKLGFSAQEIIEAQEATLALATATGSDLARSATVAASAIRGFGLDASVKHKGL